MQLINNQTIKMYQLDDDQFNVVYNDVNNIVNYLDAEYMFEVTKRYVTNKIPLFKYQQIVSNFLDLNVNQYLLK